jgi:aminoglycoside 3-N-acetyltransferase
VEIDARMLLLGVGFDRATILHLAEYALPAGERLQDSCLVEDLSHPDGQRTITYSTIRLDSSDFTALGHDFVAAGYVRTGLVGAGRSHVFAARTAAAFALDWFRAHRPAPGHRVG